MTIFVGGGNSSWPRGWAESLWGGVALGDPHRNPRPGVLVLGERHAVALGGRGQEDLQRPHAWE